jgi:hypothetical protein
VTRNGLRRASVALLAAAGLAGGAAGCGGGGQHAAAAARLPPVVVGIDANTFNSDLTRDQAAIRRLGIHDLREQVRWDVVEPHRGQWDFTSYDRRFAISARDGVRILPLLYGTARWDARSPDRLPQHAAAWARFTARVVARYGPGGSFWRAHPELDAGLAPRAFELWNEPFYGRFSVGGIDARRYAKLTAAAARAGRAANPRARFLVAGETRYDAGNGSVRDWMTDLWAAVPDLGALVDGIAVHPYTLGSPLAVTAHARDDFRRIDEIRVAAQASSGRALPLWITEVGWSTCKERPDCVSEAIQARYTAELFRLLRTRYAGRVAAAYLYGWRSQGGAGASDREGFFGILRADGSRKPSWDALRQAARAG